MCHLDCQTSLEAHIRDTVDEIFTQQPVFFCSLDTLRTTAIKMQQAFKGEVCYAVKANPRPEVLMTLSQAGITHYEIASLGEAQLVKRFIPTATIFFNNPIKTPEEIQEASLSLNIKHFTVQSIEEIDKVLLYAKGCSINDLNIAVRLKAPKSSQALINHSEKFGITLAHATDVLTYLNERGISHITLSVHIGSANHSSDITPYRDILKKMYMLSEKFPNVTGFNLGGGFPANFYHTVKRHDVPDMLRKISILFNKNNFQSSSYQYHIEPGLALVAETTVLVTPAVHVNHEDASIRIRDGLYTSYGCFNIHNHNNLPAYIYRRQGNRLIKKDSKLVLFTVYGQTCDGADKFFMQLPDTIQKNDMICLQTAGAYMGSLSTKFNRFSEVKWIFY